MGFKSAPHMPCDYCGRQGHSVLKGSPVPQERLEGLGVAVLVTDHILTEEERTALYDDPLFMRQVHRLCTECRQALIDLDATLGDIQDAK